MNRPLQADEARDLLLALPVSYQIEELPLQEAQGRVLAQELTVQVDMPPFDKSPYDGYALRSEDAAAATKENPVRLSITEEIPAGAVPSHAVITGTAAKILTGAMLPAGADCVVRYEDTSFTAGWVELREPLPAGANVIRAGEEARRGEPLLERGTLLTGAELGILASQGRAVCTVYRKPAAALLTTGSELQTPGEPLQSGKIYNTNLYTIGACLRRFGLDCRCMGSVEDDAGRIAQRIEEALEQADIVVTTGGASVGDYDYAVAAVREIGAELLFWRTRIKPGSCILAARRGEKLILSLSGNPGAALLGLVRVALPYLRKLCGRKDLYLEEMRLALREPVKKASPSTRLLRGHLEVEDGRAYFVENRGQGNGMLTSFQNFELLGEIEAGSPPLPAGAMIRAYRVRD